MPKKGKGRRWPAKPMEAQVKERFEVLLRGARREVSPLPPHWRVNPAKINQLWNWHTLEDVNF